MATNQFAKRFNEQPCSSACTSGFTTHVESRSPPKSGRIIPPTACFDVIFLRKFSLRLTSLHDAGFLPLPVTVFLYFALVVLFLAGGDADLHFDPALGEIH